jgi:hypothetical protein
VPRGMSAGRPKIQSRVDERFFPAQGHVTNYRFVDRNIEFNHVVITQKLHGTNIRIGHVPVPRPAKWYERLALRVLGGKTWSDWRMVYGSHHVVKDANNPNQQHYYDHDLWTERGHQLDGLLPKGFVVYGELVGFTSSGSPIQSHYTYDCAPRTNKMFVYRVAMVSPEGIAVDLSWDAVREFCKNLGLNHVPELYRGHMSGVSVDGFLDQTFTELAIPWNHDQPVPLSPDSPCDEGVVIRIEGINPQIYKAKSPKFIQHESKMYEDDTSVDMEADEEAAWEGVEAAYDEHERRMEGF